MNLPSPLTKYTYLQLPQRDSEAAFIITVSMCRSVTYPDTIYINMTVSPIY